MRIAVLAERAGDERRVSATPETVGKFARLGAEVAIEAGAGRGASISDEAYAVAGATVSDRVETLRGAGVILCVAGPAPDTLAGAEPGALLVGMLDPFRRGDAIAAYAAAGLDAVAMEWVPRITRAQGMDVLSSQSNLAGYKAVLDAAAEYGRAFPMMMTAAGTISAARVFVMGVGVAGLQAIATARRLGAVVSATDVRPETREQIESLGAKAIFAEGLSAAGTGGYAAELSDEQRAAQGELVSGHIAKQDVVITTALIPGRPAPRLVSAAQLAAMRPGSVLVDLAVEAGGNVEGSVAGEVVERHGVRIVGHRNVPGRLAADASALYARNLLNFVTTFWNADARRLDLPDEDEIVLAARVTRGGRVVHPRLAANG